MLTLKEILDFFKHRAEFRCQPSMDGRRNAYYDGACDAYKECATIMEKYINQDADNTSIEDRAYKHYPINRIDILTSTKADAGRDGYELGAFEQKAIDDAQWRKDMEYVNVKKQELIDKICNYILTHSTYAVQPTTYVENMKKELELGDTISPAPIQGTGNCMDAHGNFRIVNSPNTPPDRFRY